MKVELIYIPMDAKPIHLHLECAPGSTVDDVIKRSGLREQCPEIINLPVGIFSKLTTLEEKVKEGDRIEIYRPLLIDPKEKRRTRAKEKKVGSFLTQ